MKKIVMLIALIFIGASVYAQDLQYAQLSESQRKDLPKDKMIKSYKANNGKVYSIGDEVMLGSPTADFLGQNIMAYIVRGNAVMGSKQSGATAVIKNFQIINSASLSMVAPTACVIAMRKMGKLPKLMVQVTLKSDKGTFKVLDLDGALMAGEIANQ